MLQWNENKTKYNHNQGGTSSKYQLSLARNVGFRRQRLDRTKWSDVKSLKKRIMTVTWIKNHKIMEIIWEPVGNLELKSTVPEVKHVLERLNCRFEMAEEEHLWID